MKRYALIALAALLVSLTPGDPSSADMKRLRVVSLAPSSTEILFALGLDDEIVGVSQFCDYPPAALAKEKVGTFSSPNAEKILSLGPDIVFCTALEQAPAIAKLRQLGLKVCVSDPATVDELFASIREIGRFTGREERAERLIDGMRAGIAEVSSATEDVPQSRRPKVFVEFWHNPLMSAGKGSIIDELIALAGGVNVAHDTKTAYSSFSSEELIRRDPDVIILAYMQRGDAIAALRGRLGWGGIAAVRNHRVYNDIDPDTILRAGPRIVEGLRQMHRRLYPQ